MIDRIAHSPKYRSLARETISMIVAQEESHARDKRDLEHRSRRLLHRAAALYLNRSSPAALEAELTELRLDGVTDSDVREWCRAALATHDSSAERLDDLDSFYPTVLNLVGHANGPIVDLACALNSLTLPWLRAVTSAPYVGYDFNERFVALGRAFATATSEPCAEFCHQDVLSHASSIDGAIALLLKTYHCIDNRSRGAALTLVADLPVRSVVVSFPTRTLGGRRSGFDDRYGPELRTLAAREGWAVRTGSLPTETIWVIDKA